MFYDKKIKYLNYIVGGERIKGCGFVKVEIRDFILNLELVVSGLPETLQCVSEVWLCAANDNYSLGKIYLENGKGSFRLSNCNFREICPTGVTYKDWKGISVFPQEDWEISGLWGEPCSCVLERVEVSRELTGEMDEKPLLKEGVEKMPEKLEEKEEVLETSPQKSEKDVQPMRLAEDKWEQLWGIYPHMKPFRDKREYLSIRPADFVLLPAAFYKAVNNSFLLHGYYNYQHLILTRTVKKGQVSYYIGTPGNFFHKEKQVAIMFGFTGFECSKEPAREGDFGYYLMEVQL